MKCTGHLDSLMVDFSTRKQKIILTVNEDVREGYEKLKDCEKLSIEIKKYRAKRSLDANSYYWSLLTKVAEALHISKPAAHNLMLRKYGQALYIGEKIVYIVIPDTDQASAQVDEEEMYHLKPTSQVKAGKDGVMYRTYTMLRGSSDYDTKEMSELIDGLVTEAKQLGIETLPSHELERMMSVYEKHHAK